MRDVIASEQASAGNLRLPRRPYLLICLVGLLAMTAFADTQSPLAIQPFNEGVKRFNAQQYEEAISYFDRAISHDAYFAEAYYARGACQHALHHPKTRSPI